MRVKMMERRGIIGLRIALLISKLRKKMRRL
jgi:hypothetical protein